MLSSPFGFAMCLLTFTVKGVLASARLLSSDVLGKVCVLEQSYAAYYLATGQVPQATLRARSPSATPSVLCKRHARTTLQLHCAASRSGRCVSACAGLQACGCKHNAKVSCGLYSASIVSIMLSLESPQVCVDTYKWKIVLRLWSRKWRQQRPKSVIPTCLRKQTMLDLLCTVCTICICILLIL